MIFYKWPGMIYLLRHGEIGVPGERRFVGWTNTSLNETGIRRARAWREVFAGIVWEKIYTSDLDRAIRTAQLITPHRLNDIQPVMDLREIDLGLWDGCLMAEIRERFPVQWEQRGRNIATFRPVGGESFKDLSERVQPFFERIACTHSKDVLIVAHAGINRVILCRLLGMPLENLFRIAQDYGALNVIDQNRKPHRVLRMNQCAAISGDVD